MRLRHICTIATMILPFGGLAASAEAKSKSGGVEAPATSGATGSSGTTGPSEPLADLAPIVLGKHESASTVYDGPVFEVTSDGLVPFSASASSPVPTGVTTAGGTTAEATSSTSATTTTLPQLEVPGNTAEEIQVDGLGLAAAPENAPTIVQEVIWAANKIIGRPYVYGGGHKSFISWGYDCSGTVSFALHGGALLNAPLDSGQFMSWGAVGQGQWMTILTNVGHAYLDVAGLRLDTSPENDPSGLEGPRWRALRPNNFGFVKRHPIGL